jgi:hypothetical protein
MLNSDDLFLYFAQIGQFSIKRDDGTGRPEFWVPEYDRAYKDFVLSIRNSPQFDDLSNKIFQILKKLITFDNLHDRVEAYIKTEKELRKENCPHLNYNLEKLETDLRRVRPFFEAQYSKELKLKLRFGDIPDNLITQTDGRIVRLKDYLFHNGPSDQIPNAKILNHMDREFYF